MAVIRNIIVFWIIALSGAHLVEADYCTSSFDCSSSYYSYCCEDNECCSSTKYYDEFTNDNFESGLQLATGVIIAIVVVCILAIIGCIVGCVFCCRQSNAQPGRVLRPAGVMTTTTVHSGVPVQQAGYHPGQAKMPYPAGPAPAYAQPDQSYQQQGMPPPYSAQAGYPSGQNAPTAYQPMPALPPGHQTAYPPQPAAPYPSQPPYAPGTHIQSQYPTEDVPQASAPPAI